VVVIDAHLHLWDVARHRYEWLQRPENSAIRRTFGFADFAARAAAAGVDKAVLVQADDDSADTEAVFDIAREHEQIAGVVGWVPLDRPGEAMADAAARGGGQPAGVRQGVGPVPAATRVDGG
jgi:L-fuconolactonase